MHITLPPALTQLEALDPSLYRTLADDFRRLALASEALAWAQSHLPTLIAAGDTTSTLQALVRIAQEETGAPVAWALLWDKKPGSGTVSFRALAGDDAHPPDPAAISGTMLGEVVEQGRAAWSDDAQNDARFLSSSSVQAYALRSVGCIPVGDAGVLYLADGEDPGRFSSSQRMRLTALARLTAPMLKPAEKKRRKRPSQPVPGIVGDSPVMGELFDQLRAFAPMPWPALILGESGTGKESAARALHDLSPRANKSFVAVNCGAIPAELAESTLFGHERGAFTGADRQKEGLVERVRGGTLFLDEVGELPPALQVKLLRLLQEGTYERVGGQRTMRFDGRVVAATNRDLDTAEGRGEFREDLYYRLGACVLKTPPLRTRRTDVPALADHLLTRNLKELGGGIKLSISDAALKALGTRGWPGNVRELNNVIRTAIARAVSTRASTIGPEHLGPDSGPAATSSGAIPSTDLQGEVDRFQRRMVEAALAENDGHRTRTATQLGVSRQWLHRLMSRWDEDE
ncbi:MAG: sigma-54-dependent Fis family transcriptional regulator [Proteobacteria bacterium]|nr:sigma-54-dependent Fis family transcriptional regulator [Pseudomonadota bacterium]